MSGDATWLNITTPSADSYTDGSPGNTDTNYGTVITVKSRDIIGYTQHGFIKFDVT